LGAHALVAECEGAIGILLLEAQDGKPACEKYEEENGERGMHEFPREREAAFEEKTEESERHEDECSELGQQSQADHEHEEVPAFPSAFRPPIEEQAESGEAEDLI
jgi:hypothetical protein